MNTEVLHSIAIVALIALNTLMCRFLPFIIFAKKTPRFVVFLGKVLPSAIIAMLIVYCLKDMDLSSYPYGANEILGVVIVAIVQLAFKIPALSIVCGTAFYMILVQNEIFALS